jgi:hypothetical protein
MWLMIKESRGLFWIFNEVLGSIRCNDFLDQINDYSILWTTYTEISCGVSTLRHLLCLEGSRLLPHKRECKLAASLKASDINVMGNSLPIVARLYINNSPYKGVPSRCTAFNCLSSILLTLQVWNLLMWDYHLINFLKPCRQWSLLKWTTKSIRNESQCFGEYLCLHHQRIIIVPD